MNRRARHESVAHLRAARRRWRPLRSAVLALALVGANCKSPASSVEAAAPETTSVATLLPPKSTGLEPNATDGAIAQPRAEKPAAEKRFTPHSTYPAGAWRSHAGELERIVLWPSHLLIRYDGVKISDSVSFSMADFRAVPPPATRTRAEALALAIDLARRAREQPQRFADLVREHSEDLVGRESGGSLGGIPASQLSPWPEVLDALSQLKPGEISDPVETWYGFHVLKRRAPPAADTVSGRRIVITHSDAGFSRVLSGIAPTRSRAEAFALAQRVYSEAKANPERFSELVRQHSEHRDRQVGGDFGTWSNREPAPFPREIEVLDGLDVGEVAPPFDSLFGIQVVQRVENRQRLAYAIDGLRLYFDPKAPATAQSSRENVQALALRYNRELLETPSLLPELQARHHRYNTQWLDGRGSPEVTAALAAVAPGELLPEPTRSVSHYVIGRRTEPARRPAPEPAFELP